MVMPVVEPARRWALVAAHHVHDLPPRVAEVAALWGLGMANHDIASVLGIEPATVDRHGERARELLVPPELDSTRSTVQCWAQAHSTCCIATQWARFTAA